MGTSATVIPATARLVTRGGAYDIQSVQASFNSNGVNVCIVSLAVGRKETGTAIVSVGFKRGDEARVEISNAAPTTTQNVRFGLPFNKTEFTLFDGVIDDFGPSDLSFGSFSIQVRIFGRLAYLASGALDSSNIVPKSNQDTAILWAYGQAGEDSPGRINMATASQDFWHGLKVALNNIASMRRAPKNSTTQFIQDKFGEDGNIEAQQVFSEITGSLLWRDQAEAYAPGIVTSMNEYMMRQWFMEPFLHRIAAFGEMLHFRILENGSGIKVVPYHPFFRRRDAYDIGPDTFDKFSWQIGEYRSYAGAVLVDGSGHDQSQITTGRVAGYYKMRGTPLGQVHVGTVPGFLTGITEAMSTGGDGVRSFNGSPDDTAARAGAITIPNRFAKILTWDLNYRNRKFTVECPFMRSDIGPLTAIRVSFPNVPEIVFAATTPAVYGSVESVDIVLDAAQGYARTRYTCNWARSYDQQEYLIDPDLGAGEHPFFTTNYIGGRLDSTQSRGVSAG
jgi:hypothetical protein